MLKDPLSEYELDTAKDALIILSDPNGPNTLLLVTNDAVCARLADVLNDELVLKELDRAQLDDSAYDELVENDADLAKLAVVLKDELRLKELDRAQLELKAFELDTE